MSSEVQFTAVYSQGDPGKGIGGCDLADSRDQGFAFDYEGDGVLNDLVFYRPGGGVCYILQNKGGNHFARVNDGGGIGGYDLADSRDQGFAFDYEGDGVLNDLVFYRPGGGVCYILQNKGGGQFTRVNSGSGIGGYDLADSRDQGFAFDYEGDGNLNDLVFYRPGGEVCYILQYKGGPFARVNSGSGIGGYDLKGSSDQGFAFDYEGDGELNDLVFYRPGGGAIFILQNQINAPKPIITFGSAPYDFMGSWHHMTPEKRDLINQIQKDPSQVKPYVESGIRTSRFLQYIQEGGEDVFGDGTDAKGNPVKLAVWTDETGVDHECQIKAGLSPVQPFASVGSAAASPVPASGTTGKFIADSQGNLCFTVQRIEKISGSVGIGLSVAGIVEWATIKILTKVLNDIKGTAQDATELATRMVRAGSDLQEVGETLLVVERLESAIKYLKWFGNAAMALGILQLLVDGFFALFHKMTYSLSMWNETKFDLEYSITYMGSLNDGEGITTWINNLVPSTKPEDWKAFPKMNAVEDGLIPLGGGLKYDKVAAADLIFANGDKDTMISASGIRACVSIRKKGTTDNVFVILSHVPLVGKNAMHLGTGAGDLNYYNSTISSATNELSTSYEFTVDGTKLVASMHTDQVEHETNYGGIQGYNYNALLYLKEKEASA